jgi:SNF2 family DNA or RNA helicase
MLDYFPYRVGLAGMPAPNGYLDLFGQYYAIDDGIRLGRTLETYKTAYFTGGNGIGSKPRLVGGAKQEIHRRIEDITFALTSDEILALPPIRYNDVFVDLPPRARELYDQMERDLFAAIDDGRIVAANAGVASGKCRQLANGIIIDTETGKAHPVHDLKMEVLDEHLEESSGRGVVVAYQFVEDRERIIARFGKDYRICTLGSEVGAAEAERRVGQWNAGEYDMFLAHPASAGHGLNIQYFSNQILWFGVDYNYELFGQMNARLRRPGQPHDHVMVHRVIARDTIEDNVILPSLSRKATEQDGLMSALKRYRDLRYGNVMR